MSTRLGPAALKLAGIAARLLGWRPDEFWSATPAELGAALTAPGTPLALDRAGLDRLMEHDHDR